ncbi:peptidoglycan-associated lipoprotein Pal [Candidatus Fukatsuia symbiotica]|uniref:Peptidoglycan-associated lipoprotein n=1 Tax=Candidatus Fukatsuia symbiotica TaxID=1878942 RepID=A0A2U8I9J7_9GAMM|nr:peptidoglycan-associated lipoprotein Pal [Candidatus Fukatsuia symbiotica]AWK14704.1 peptidoglycan-associated lipoprotein [Candidatus Fukatsuia symbiotica]MEA9445032.1 peptidoglycan-associated lipoprotein Pal [Candidatus Fukatsuia symbiotica]
MQLNKMLKGLMLVLPVLAVAACSSNKKVDNDQSAMGSDSGMSSENISSLSSGEQARLQMQELQANKTVYFGLDKYDVNAGFMDMLNKHANFLRDNPKFKVTVEGYADERGTPEYNIALGERRANAVGMYLQGKGVSADRISIVSYGKAKPAELGHNEQAYAKNRRAVLVY